MTRFFDASIRPPRGGWSFPLNGELVTGYSESELIDIVRKWKINNGVFTSEGAIQEEIWEYFCGREPERCGRSGVTSTIAQPPKPGQAVMADKTPELQGPPIWTFLNTLAAQWNPGMHQYFLATVDAIIVILECSNCREEWRRLLGKYPPVDLATRLEVCQWVNRVHNEVNAKKGKTQFPYVRMVTEYGAPPEL